MIPNFTLDSYSNLLEQLLNAGYQFRPFPARVQEIVPSGAVYLRHDIDLDPMAALRLMNIERALSVKATYFFMVTSPIYNIFSVQCRNLIYRNLYPRSDVAVHVDVTDRTGIACLRKVHRDCATFEGHYSIYSPVVSFHRPGEHILQAGNSAGLTTPRLHTYMPELFREIGYFSDSGGCWRDYPIDSECFRQRRSMQILVHPEWWHVTERTARQRLDDLRRTIDKRFDTHLHLEFTKVFQNAR